MIDDVDVGSTKKQLAVDGEAVANANRRRMAWRTTFDNIIVNLWLIDCRKLESDIQE